MSKFTERLREALRDADIKASDLSRITGIDKGSISHYLSGRYEPKHTNIKKIADALNLDETWLLGFDVEKERKPAEESAKKTKDLRDEMSQKMLKHIVEIYNQMPFDKRVDIYEAVRFIELREEAKDEDAK